MLRLALHLQRQLAQKQPAALLRKLWFVAANTPRQVGILRVLAQPAFAEYTLCFPCLRYRYLRENDLARSFTVAQRAACHLHHYRFLSTRFSEDSVRQIMNRHVSLFELCEAGNRFAIDLAAPRNVAGEGELRLHFRIDGINIFDLAFSFIPGWVVDSAAQNVILISALQGVKGRHDSIRLAEKAFHGIWPAALPVTSFPFSPCSMLSVHAPCHRLPGGYRL